MTMCNVKGDACSHKPTEKDFQLCSFMKFFKLYWLIVLVFIATFTVMDRHSQQPLLCLNSHT